MQSWDGKRLERPLLADGAGMITVLLFIFAALHVPCVDVAASAALNLYQARTIVTGQREETRGPGLERCLEDVLVKVSGDPLVLADPALAGMKRNAASYVAEFRYGDRMEGIPIHDEQGSRDRPYDLTVDFQANQIDAALRSLGREPWTAPRPRLVVFLGVRLGTATYMLARDGYHRLDQRDSLAAAAWQMGLPVELPTNVDLGVAGLTFETLPLTHLADLDVAAKKFGGDLALAGSLVWDKKSLGWAAGWRLVNGGRVYRWQIRDVNFDDAFRSGVRGAAQILSGHGQPR